MPPVAAAVTAFVAWGATSTLAAVAVGAAIGCVTGAVVGATVALTTGGDVGKGALYGAAIGAVGGAVTGGLSSALSAPASATVATTPSAAAPVVGAETAPLLAGASNVAVNVPTMAPAQVASLTAAEALKQAGTSQIYAGMGMGTSQAVGQVGAGLIEEKGTKKRSEKELEAERASASERFSRETERIAGNVPGQFEAQVANVALPDWWDRHLRSNTLNVGLLSPAPPITPIPIGV